MKINSYFVEIIEKNNKKYIKRKVRKGIKPYARTLKLKQISSILSTSDILYSKVLKSHYNYVIEDYIDSTQDITSLSKEELMNYFIDTIIKFNNIDLKKFNKYIKWNNNSEFMLFQINNLKQALKIKKINNPILLKELDNINTKLDNTRKLTFIHGDLHQNNLIINNDNIYLIDLEMSTIGDLAYELAIHFILMNYTEEEQTYFIDKIVEKTKVNKENLIKDINEYKKFELLRRNILHGDTSNHFH